MHTIPTPVHTSMVDGPDTYLALVLSESLLLYLAVL
jgi:hypothetical protein